MYNYQEQRPQILTESGLQLLLEIRDKAYRLLEVAGAVRSDKLLIGDSWKSLACIDFMVERGELIEVTSKGVAGQDRVFVKRWD